ncbi:type II toxin-antitoxin system RelE/ParE family toxin [Saccharothrix longispora]|uniref:type II toxin-antitoxin system RelE family toxin n=1 Tax=Saccharothrix longispora TaxID=33920 RepID=UPI0028FD7278|nr:type II toxin-antitoxin system RelE/ParE family toxin [Saccharothrix longispora]MDU0289487.1 type II toxin-antitoxin system RelE/ParE family toxin [Saccharothrix longispora]
MAKVVLTGDAREDLRDLDGSARKIVLKAINKLKVDPEKRGQPLGVRSGSDLTTFRKLVVGDRDYRIVYRVENDGTIVVVWVIGRRVDDECYQLAVSRLRLYADRPAADAVQNLMKQAWAYSPE